MSDHDGYITESIRPNKVINAENGVREVQDFFIDREREKHQILSSLRHSDFIALIGNQGAGKTSFVTKEVIPILKEGFFLGATEAWKVISFRPGKRPIDALSTALSRLEVVRESEDAKVDPGLDRDFRSILEKKYGIIEIIEEHRPFKGFNLLLFIDNLDDLYDNYLNSEEVSNRTGTRDGEEAKNFVDRLTEVVQQTAYPVHIITTLRTDVSSRFSVFPQLAELINRNQFILSDVSNEDMVEVLEKVGEAEKITFSEDFKEQVKEEEISLGSFKHALKRTISKVLEEEEDEVSMKYLQKVSRSGELKNTIETQFIEILLGFCARREMDQKICESIFFTLKSLEEREYSSEEEKAQALNNLAQKFNHSIVPATFEDLHQLFAPFRDYGSLFEEVEHRENIEHFSTISQFAESLGITEENVTEAISPLVTCKRVFQAITNTKKEDGYQLLPRAISEIANITNSQPEEIIAVVKPFIARNSGILEIYQTQGIVERLENLDLDSDDESGLTISSEIVLARDEIIELTNPLKSWIGEEHENAQVYKDLYKSVENNEPPYEGKKLDQTESWYLRFQPHQGWANRYHIDHQAVETFLNLSLDKRRKEEETRKADKKSRDEKARRNRMIIIGFLIFSLGLLAWGFIKGIQTRKAVRESKKAILQAASSTIKAENARQQASLDSLKASLQSKKADSAQARAEINSEKAAKALIDAQDALQKADRATKDANEKQKQLAISNDLLEKNRKKSEALALQNEISAKKNQFLDSLQKITLVLEEIDRVLKNSSDPVKQEKMARQAVAQYDYLTILLKENDTLIKGSKDYEQLSKRAKNGVLASMQLAYRKINLKDSLRKIRTSVSISQGSSPHTFLIVSNENDAKVSMYNSTTKVLNEVVPIPSDPLKRLGAYKVRLNNAKDKYLISHAPVEQGKRHISWYSQKGDHLDKQLVQSTVVAIYPYGQKGFLVADQDAQLWLLDGERNSKGKFEDPQLLYPQSDAEDNGSIEVKDKSRTNKLHAITLGEERSGDITIFMAIANEGLWQLRVQNRSVESSLEMALPSALEKQNITALKYLPGKKQIAIGDRNGTINFLQINNLILEPIIPAKELEHDNNINVLEADLQEKWLISGGRDGLIKIWEIAEFSNNKYEPPTFEINESIREVVFDNDKKILVSSSTEGLKGDNQGTVTEIFLDFDEMADKLRKLLRARTP